MESLISRFFFHNWQQKIVALVSAMIIWVFVNHSIIETKTIPGVPIRIVNLPPDKTILGLQPNGLLNRRITLTLTGTKDVIHDLEAGDVEVLIDAHLIDHDDWVTQISKKNLVSLNPAVDLAHHVSQVEHTEHILKLRKVIQAKIPIIILPPTGNPPEGYEFLDIWPQKLFQTLTGAEEEIQSLKAQGLEVTFDLMEITKADLDSVKSAHNSLQDDEITFMVPAKWKKVSIPFHHTPQEEINDPEAQHLRIDFLRKELLPLTTEIPIRIFFPARYSQTLNPRTLVLQHSDEIMEKNDLTFFRTPLFAQGVSRLFLKIVQENLELTLVAAPKNERATLQWSMDIVDPHTLEDAYVAYLFASQNHGKNNQTSLAKSRETVLRNRFREYIQSLTLFTGPDQRLKIEGTIEGNVIRVATEN